MRRREFIELFGGALMAWPLPAQAQRGKLARIGIIDNAPVWDAFRQGMRDLGYVEGQSIAYEYRNTDGTPEQLSQAAAELVRIPVDLIATFGTPPSKAAKAATSTIPIVMVSIGDPIGSGLVPSMARPGGNITGQHYSRPGNRRQSAFQLLQEVLPQGLARCLPTQSRQRLECDNPRGAAAGGKDGGRHRDADRRAQRRGFRRRPCAGC